MMDEAWFERGAIARYGVRVRNPIRLYAGLELAIAVAGVVLVWALPVLAGGHSHHRGVHSSTIHFF
jgi:hypothetical protein